jgi:hypothetical protein
VHDQGGKLGAQVEAAAARELRAALQSTPGVMLAPADESREAASEALRRGNLRGYQLSVSLKGGPGRTLSMNVLSLTYPERTLLQEVAVGAQGGDPESLVRLLAPMAVERTAQMLDWSQP